MNRSRTSTAYPHIVRDTNGVLRVDGTPYKVRLLIEAHLWWGLTEEGFLRHYPLLSKAQYHAMLAYYYDHKVELDAEIESVRAEVARLRAESHAAHPEFYGRMRSLLGQQQEPVSHEAPASPT